MIRSILAVVALVILSGFAVAPPLQAQQQEPRTHEVREGDTLWKIAQEYYDNGWHWTRIYEANRDRLDDPESLDVGLVLNIPALAAEEPVEPEAPEAEEEPEEPAAEVGGVQVETPQEPQEARGPKPIESRTAFYPEQSRAAIGGEERPPLSAVSRDVVFSSPWLVAEGLSPDHTGELVGFAGADGDVTARVSVRPHDRVLITFEGPAPAVGSLLQVFRTTRDLTDVGSVAEPTGVLRIDELQPAGAVATVEKLYGQMALGDLVGPLPEYTVVPGRRAQPVDGGAAARIIGFPNERPLYSVGDAVFLDPGAATDVGVGDEYVVVFSSGPGWSGEAEGRLQVTGVRDGVVTARIIEEENPIFSRNVQVRLDRRMR